MTPAHGQAEDPAEDKPNGSHRRLIFQQFSRSTVAPIGRKKSASTFLLPKKNTFGGEPPSGAP